MAKSDSESETRKIEAITNEQKEAYSILQRLLVCVKDDFYKAETIGVDASFLPHLSLFLLDVVDSFSCKIIKESKYVEEGFRYLLSFRLNNFFYGRILENKIHHFVILSTLRIHMALPETNQNITKSRVGIACSWKPKALSAFMLRKLSFYFMEACF